MRENIFFTPSTCGQKGGSFRPLQRRGLVRPKNVLGNKNGVRARHGLRASYQLFGIAFEAGWRTWKRLPCVRFAYTPKWPKNQGVYPPLTIFLFVLAQTS